ncbi:MAG: carboxypeptidase regulatory-like domain-containing protein [Planctomycetes bacterium]|nr:carboxypeptidase regulatory-like domain-containing protein [Planctomycetota bacterium]
MSRSKSLWIGIFAALLIIALGIALSPFGQGDRGDGVASRGGQELLASLPAIGADSKINDSGGRETASAPSRDMNVAATREGFGKVIVLDGKPNSIPPGTRVVIRYDNPDFMSAMSLGQIMRLSFQKGPAGQRELVRNARKNHREGAAFSVAADGTFKIDAPRDLDFYLDIKSDGLVNDTWEVHHAADNPPFIVRARRGVSIRGKVQSADGKGVGGAQISFLDHRMPGSGGRVTTPRDIRAESSSDGLFILNAVPSGGAGTIVARHGGFGANSASLKLVGEIPNITITLTPAARLVGKIVSETGDPIEGASVSPLFGDFATYQIEIEREPIKTNREGAFELKDIPAVRVRARAEKTGWRPANSEYVDIRPGATTDLGVLILKNGSVISGVVVDPDAKAVEGAVVRLEFSTQMSQLESGEGGSTVYDNGEAVTDAEGKFKIEGMGKGPYDLEATHAGFAPGRKKRHKDTGEPVLLKLKKPGSIAAALHWPENCPAPTGGDIAIEISRPVGPGFNLSEVVKSQPFEIAAAAAKTPGPERSTIVIFDDVTPGSYTLTIHAKGFARAKVPSVEVKQSAPAEVDVALTPGVNVSGRVVDRASRAGLNGARVTVTASMLDSFRSDLPTTTAGDDGNFELADLDAGPITLAAQFADHARQTLSLQNLAPGAHATNVEIALSAGGGIEGQAFDEDGLPMAGGVATVNAPDRGEFEQVLLDRDGRFAVYRLSQGVFQVSVLRGSFLSDMGSANPAEILKGMRFTTAEVKEGEITKLVLGEDRGNLVKVRGIVKSRNDVVAGAIVSAMSQAGALKGGNPPRFNSTDAQGAFEMSLPPGRVVFTIQRMSGSQSGAELPVEIPDRPTYDLLLNLPLGSIEGIVRGPKNEGLSGQPIMLAIETGPVGSLMGAFGQATTDEEGRFRFENLAAGTYLISAGGANAFMSDPGSSLYGRVSKKVSIQESEQLKNMEFSIGVAGSIVGSVVSGGQPVPSASIFLQMPDGQPVTRVSDVFTNSGGQFRARGVAAGQYRMLIRAKGLASRFVDPVAVESGHDTELQIELTAGATVIGHIADGEGKPVTGFAVVLTDSDGRRYSGFAGVTEFAQWFADGPPAPGDVRLGTLGQGHYRANFTKSGYNPAAVEFDISDANGKSIDVRLNKQ